MAGGGPSSPWPSSHTLSPCHRVKPPSAPAISRSAPPPTRSPPSSPQVAEQARHDVAVAWLGHALPDWPSPLPARVTIDQTSGHGYTSFGFDGGRVISRSGVWAGRLHELLVDVVPHEVTHTIFADHFGRPLPRWFDEGGAVLSESASGQAQQDRMLRQITPQQNIALARLLRLTEYPHGQVGQMYAEG